LNAGVSPGLTAGSGLKLGLPTLKFISTNCISRLNRRERIETIAVLQLL